MKLSAETILERIEKNGYYFTKVRAELRNDPNFVKLALLRNPMVYYNLNEEEQQNPEVIQICLDNAVFGNLPPYEKVQDEKQKEELANLYKVNGYLRLYSKVLGCETYDEKYINIVKGIKLKELAKNKEFFENIDALFEGLTEDETNIIRKRFGLDGYRWTEEDERKSKVVRGYAVPKRYCVEVISPRNTMYKGLSKMRKNYLEKYKDEPMTLKLK